MPQTLPIVYQAWAEEPQIKTVDSLFLSSHVFINRKRGAPPTRFGNGKSKPVTKRWATRPAAPAVLDASLANGTLAVTHFTSDAGVAGITESGGVLRSGTYVTTPSQIPAGATSTEVEGALEIGEGKGSNSITFNTPKSNLAVPENGATTSGGATQYQLKQPTQIDPTKIVKTPPPPGSGG